MNQIHGKCVWCDGPRLTKSHIWPEWLEPILPARGTQHLVQYGAPTQTFVSKARGYPPFEKLRQGSTVSRRPRNTCITCNGGWMRRMEEAAKPIASALIIGQHRLLNFTDQWLLAALLCLITCRQEFTDRASMAIPAGDRERLMKYFAPGPSWQIWIARYNGAYPGTHSSHHWGMRIVPSSSSISDGPSDECNSQIATMIIGRLCAHLFSSTVLDNFGGYRQFSLCRIWPPSQFYIDPWSAPGLSDEEIIALHEAFPAAIKAVGEK
jgi:hypothetical protein